MGNNIITPMNKKKSLALFSQIMKPLCSFAELFL